MQPPTDQPITQGQHGTSKAVDYRAYPDDIVYAPEDATFDSYQQRGSGVNDAGNALRIRGANGLHQFAHLSESFIKSGSVKRGQPIARMGYTGYVIPAGAAGKHLHYWVRRPDGSYTYPPNLYTLPFKKGATNQGDDSMSLTTDSVKVIYRRLLKREGDAGGVKNYTGKSLDFTLKDMVGSKEFTALHTKIQTVEKPVPDPAQKAQIEELTKAVKIKDNEIEKLKAQVGESNKWETLKALIRELIGR